jgi:hypothetical protein
VGGAFLVAHIGGVSPVRRQFLVLAVGDGGTSVLAVIIAS